MNKITLDPTTLAKLSSVGQRVELCDPSGRTLGYFVPIVAPAANEAMDSPLSEEELDRRAQQRTGRSLAEIMTDLEKRA
jgi:hypothetical protein